MRKEIDSSKIKDTSLLRIIKAYPKEEDEILRSLAALFRYQKGGEIPESALYETPRSIASRMGTLENLTEVEGKIREIIEKSTGSSVPNSPFTH